MDEAMAAAVEAQAMLARLRDVEANLLTQRDAAVLAALTEAMAAAVEAQAMLARLRDVEANLLTQRDAAVRAALAVGASKPAVAVALGLPVTAVYSIGLGYRDLDRASRTDR